MFIYFALAGHGFCEKCNGKLRNVRAPECPQCRVKVRKTEGHRLFIEFAHPNDPTSDDAPPSDDYPDAVVRQVKHVTRCMGLMDADSRVKSVKHAEKHLRQAAQVIGDQGIVPLTVIYASFLLPHSKIGVYLLLGAP